MRRRFNILLLLLAWCTIVVAQQNGKVQNRPYIDLRPFHYGFSIGLHQQSIIMPNTGYIDPETGQQWWVSNDNYSPGFTVGLIGEWRINQYLAARVLPTLHFASKHITFHEQTTGQTDYQDMKSTYIAVPLNLK
ncbi:MAG: outer membrane beta-barrel protein, partial [Bacteroidaceae bacterium]|nr:outer membrane beta-barrel protein [Bacteroidaceae bacterium]